MSFYRFQIEDVRWWSENGRRGIFAWEVGTGKTYVGARMIAKEAGRSHRCLVVAPPSLVRSWRDECASVGVDMRLAWKEPNAQVSVCTYDRLDYVVTEKYDIIIADEAHRIKNYSSKRSKRFLTLARRTPQLLMMTGTLTNYRDAAELLNYLWCLGNCQEVPTRITEYRNEYCRKKRVGAHTEIWVSTVTGARLLDAAIKRNARFRKLREELEIPELVEETRYVKAGIDLTRKVIDAANAMNIELDQIDVNYGQPHITHALIMANGYDHEEKVMANNAKITAIQEILEDLGDEQCIIWVYWRGFAEAMAKALGDDCRLIYGGTSPKAKDDTIAGFKAGTIKYLVASIGSIAEGHNLQNCRYSIVANQWYDVIKDMQSRGRIERSGQKNSMVQIRIVSEGTLEEDVMEVLNKKMSLHDAQTFLNKRIEKRYKDAR